MISYAMPIVILCVPLAGVALRMALRLVYGVRGPKQGNHLYAALNAVGWALILLGALILGLLSLFGFVVVLFVVLGALLEYVLARRSFQRDLAWSLVGHAQRQGQDIPKIIKVQQDRFTGVVREDLQGLAWQLRRGDSLPSAVAVWHKAFPYEAQGYAAIGKQDGRLAYEPLPIGSAPLSQMSGSLAYLFWILLTGIVMLTGVMMYIVPALTEIYSDFGMELPRITTNLATVSSLADQSGLGVLVVSFGSLALALSALSFVFLLADVPFLNPIWDRLLFNRRRALALRLLAVAAERNAPLTQTLHDLGMGRPRFPAQNVAKKLLRAYRAAASGADWKQVLVGVGLLRRSEAPLLAAAEQAQNLPWALRALADRTDARWQLRWQAAGKIAFPLAILLFGALVLWVCAALFLPLVNLIKGLV